MILNRTSLCEICKKHIGMGYDHSARSKQKQAKNTAAKPTRERKLRKASVRYLGGIA